ncbi:hypothetical protein [Bradyrhizobium sp. USDA 3256]
MYDHPLPRVPDGFRQEVAVRGAIDDQIGLPENALGKPGGALDRGGCDARRRPDPARAAVSRSATYALQENLGCPGRQTVNLLRIPYAHYRETPDQSIGRRVHADNDLVVALQCGEHIAHVPRSLQIRRAESYRLRSKVVLMDDP